MTSIPQSPTVRQDSPPQSGLVPPIPRSIDVRVGVRWIGVGWRPDPDAPPPQAYRLIISPGRQILEFGSQQNWIVLTSAPAGRSYTFAVAAVGPGGRGPWRTAPSVWLSRPREPREAIHATTFAELLQMGDGPLRHLLEGVDDEDLLVALECAPVSVRRRLLEEILPPDRAFDLARRLGQAGRPVPVSDESLRQGASAALIPFDPRNAPPEIVVTPASPSRILLYAPWIALVGLLAVALFLSLRTPVAREADRGDVAATVEALVATRVASLPESEQASFAVNDVSSDPTTAEIAPDADFEEALSDDQSQDAGDGGSGEPLVARPEVDQLNLREGPDERFLILDRLAIGESVRPLGRSSDGRWLYVDAGERKGWVAGWLVELNGSEEELPVQAHSSPPTPTPVPLSPTAVQRLVVPPPAPTVRPTPQLVAVLSTRVATRRPTPVPTSRSPAGVASASGPCGLEGNFWLIEPVDKAVHNLATFRWGYSLELPDGCGFEVRLWRPGEPPQGVHDAVADNRSGAIRLTQQNEYRLEVPYLHDLPSVGGRSGDYRWTVALVAIDPIYRDLGIQAAPARVWMDPQP